MQAPALTPEQIQQEISRLAARLMYLQNTEKQIKKEVEEIKAECERLYSSDIIPAKNDMSLLFSDESTQKVRLSRQATGTYFKPGDDFKDEFTAKKHKLEASFLTAGKATMAEKACTWKVQVVK